MSLHVITLAPPTHILCFSIVLSGCVIWTDLEEFLSEISWFVLFLPLVKYSSSLIHVVISDLLKALPPSLNDPQYLECWKTGALQEM